MERRCEMLPGWCWLARLVSVSAAAWEGEGRGTGGAEARVGWFGGDREGGKVKSESGGNDSQGPVLPILAALTCSPLSVMGPFFPGLSFSLLFSPPK